MHLDVFDANIVFGRFSVLPAYGVCFTEEEELLAAMSRFSISRGIVRHAYGRDYHPAAGNERLAGLRSDRVEKCFALLPHYTGEMGSAEEIVDHLKSRMIRFVTFYPATHNYFFSSHTCGALLGLLAEEEIVILLEQEEVEYERVYEVCRHIPELHVVLLGAAYRDNRYIYPLLEEVENVYVGLSRFCGAGFIEDVVKRFGPHRLVFGSNLPLYSPGGPLTALLYADISEDAKRMIAGNNLRSLLGEIDES